ncbi:MAG: tetratricopeptide repeat protein [Planctomycetes bacterium]|nr:tetratricopeptide repeat protein [Planctomycetota bacterium]
MPSNAQENQPGSADVSSAQSQLPPNAREKQISPEETMQGNPGSGDTEKILKTVGETSAGEIPGEAIKDGKSGDTEKILPAVQASDPRKRFGNLRPRRKLPETPRDPGEMTYKAKRKSERMLGTIVSLFLSIMLLVCAFVLVTVLVWRIEDKIAKREEISRSTKSIDDVYREALEDDRAPFLVDTTQDTKQQADSEEVEQTTDLEAFETEIRLSPRTWNYNVLSSDLDELLALPDQNLDLAWLSLMFEGSCGRTFDRLRILSIIDGYATEIRRRIGRSSHPMRVIEIMNEYIFGELGYDFDSSDPRGEDSENLFLSAVVTRKRGYCLSLSMLYAAIAQRVGIRIKAAFMPGHVIARYESDNLVVNIETTFKGHPYYSDTDYCDNHGFAVTSEFMRQLSYKETLALMIVNYGTIVKSRRGNQRALEMFEKAATLFPRCYIALQNRGQTFADLGDDEKASSDLKAAIELFPRAYDAILKLAEIARIHKDFEAASLLLARAFSIRSDDPEWHLQSGILLYAEGRPDEAEPALKKSIAMGYPWFEPHFFIALIQRERGEKNESLQAALEALRIKPSSADVLLLLAELKDDANEFDAADDYYARAVVSGSDRTAVLRKRAAMRFREGKFILAREHFTALIPLTPDDPSVYESLAACELRLGNQPGAITALESALEKGGNPRTTCALLAKLYFNLGVKDKAREHALRCQSLGVQDEAIDQILDATK